MQKATITDIAKALGVTASTVSRALSGNPRVKSSTREAIEQKARELGYERNVLAANLRKGTASLVGIIVPRINREFFSNIISSAESVLNQAGYSVLICQSQESLENELRAFRSLLRNQVAAIMVSHALDVCDGSPFTEFATGRTPIIQFDRVIEEMGGTRIVSDNFGGAYAATTHLIEQGYRRIGALAGPPTSSVFRGRLRGYQQALLDHGMAADEALVFRYGILRESGHTAAQKALNAGCDALYSMGDYSALGALTAVKEAGLRVPEDFGIVGTANETFTSLTSPSLSSLSQNPQEMGRQLAEAFLLGGSPEPVVIPMELQIRASSRRR